MINKIVFFFAVFSITLMLFFGIKKQDTVVIKPITEVIVIPANHIHWGIK